MQSKRFLEDGQGFKAGNEGGGVRRSTLVFVQAARRGENNKAWRTSLGRSERSPWRLDI